MPYLSLIPYHHYNYPMLRGQALSIIILILLQNCLVLCFLSERQTLSYTLISTYIQDILTPSYYSPIHKRRNENVTWLGPPLSLYVCVGTRTNVQPIHGPCIIMSALLYSPSLPISRATMGSLTGWFPLCPLSSLTQG
jgi:hypothetical protein